MINIFLSQVFPANATPTVTCENAAKEKKVKM